MDLINILFAKALSNGNTDKEYVDEAIKALKGEVSADLDTLEELSKALGNDTDFFLSVKNELDNKVTKDELNSYITFNEQTLTESQQAQARANIGAGTSNFSGSYNDLSDKPIEETEDDAMEMLTEMGVLDPITDEEGNVLTDENSNVLSI